MTLPSDLLNRGFILNPGTGEPGRTLIVTGPFRSGTSLVAAMLQQAGLFIGSEINDIVFEDEAIGRVLTGGDVAALQAMIADRNAQHPRWGFKFPMLCRVLRLDDLRLFDRPRLIVTFRDPLATAVRTAISEYQDAMQALRDAVADQASMMAYAARLDCPSLLLSYEKALTFPHDFVDALMRFCDFAAAGDLRERLLGTIELNRQRYITGARRRFEGLIEGVRAGQLYGWCRLTRSLDPVTLDVLVDGRVALRLVADAPRGDLAEAGIGNGRHGFFVPLEALQARPDSVIRVKVAERDIELTNSGKRLCDFGTAA